MERRIKVLFTTSNFKTAGSGKVIYDLISGIDPAKFEIEIACSHNEGDFFKTIKSLQLPIHIFNTKTTYQPYSLLPSRIRCIMRFFETHNYDIVHSWQWSSDWTEALAARLSGAKWIYTKKAMGFKSKHWFIKSYLANFIITINDEMKDYFSYKKSQKLIPLGIDLQYYSPQHFPIKIKTENFNVITVANLVPVKGVEILIEALHELNDNTIHLTIVGDHNNSYGKQLETLSKKLNVSDQVVFLGKQFDVRPYIANADLYVIPTLDEGRKEGMPMALVEAMSMAVPVLGSNISGIKYVLRDFQEFLFKAGDFKELAELILKLKSLPYEEQRIIGKNLREYCLINFGLRTFIKAHEELYEELMAN